MAVRFQLVMNCADPDLLARFWAAALGYELEPPPAGFASWDDWRRDVGLLESVGVGADSIVDPDGVAPRIWFQSSPDGKTVPNRLHLDIHASGEPTLPIETRRERVDAVARRLCDLGATLLAASDWSPNFYAVAMKDPEGNEFDIN
jgi:Glyoxalase-like domain